MWSVLAKSLVSTGENACSVLRNTKRFAGHSKWANIKHIKAQNDGERAIVFAKLLRQMKVAIVEGGSSKPTENVKLSQTIEQAKKKNMPVATINGFLEKMSKVASTTQTSVIDVRGPGGCIIIIELVTDNPKRFKMLITGTLKRYNATIIDHSSRYVFLHKGIVITNLLGDLDAATENAITVGAEDVEIVEDNGEKCFQFTCEPSDLPKVAHQLAALKYNVIYSEDRYTPHIFAHLSDAEVNKMSSLYTKLQLFEEIVRIHDNVA